MDNLQFVYFNSLAWYGARLALELLNNYARGFNIIGSSSTKIIPANTDKAVLFSFLSDREYPKIYKALDNVKVPYLSKDRNDTHPIIIVGGAACYQPEPIADMVDIFCVGDGEEFLMGITKALEETTKAKRLAALAELPGAYIPANRQIIYDDTGFFVKDMLGETSPVYAHTTDKWLSSPAFGKNEGHEIEIARGCNMSCAFCAITWRNQYRERPRDNAIVELQGRTMEFFSPNTGGVSYFSDLFHLRSKGSQGDITVNDFLNMPEPDEGEYEGARFTFGVEGLTPRLRRIVGKPITDDMMEECERRLIKGRAIKWQLYFIRNVPGETMDDFEELEQWVHRRRKIWNEAKLATEIQFTPLTKQAHTPFQWFSHEYNLRVEERVMALLQFAREEKVRNPASRLYITPSRRAASWLIDNITNCLGRNGRALLWASHKGVFDRIRPDGYPGESLKWVEQVAEKSGIHLDSMIGDIPFNKILPWSHILPARGELENNLLKSAKSIARRLNKSHLIDDTPSPESIPLNVL